MRASRTVAWPTVNPPKATEALSGARGSSGCESRGLNDGTPVGSVWAELSPEEAWDLLDHLLANVCGKHYDDLRSLIIEGADADLDPSWHAHIGGPDELTISVEQPDPG